MHLKSSLEALKMGCTESQLRYENEQARCSTFMSLLEGSEQACAKFRNRLGRKLRWREEAEQRTRAMVAYGQGLERECASLRKEVKRLRRRRQGRSMGLVPADCGSLEQEEQLGEILRARLQVLEEDNAALVREAEDERCLRLSDAVLHGLEVSALNREQNELSAQLQAAEHTTRASNRLVAEEVDQRRKLVETYTQERSNWAEAHAVLEQHDQAAKQDLEVVRRAEMTEVHLAESAAVEEAIAEARVKQLDVTAAETARLTTESSQYEQAVRQLTRQLSQAQQLQACLQMQLVAARSPPEPLDMSGPSTPQLQELDSYAELVDRLQAEVSRERAEREASVSSLATLRGSYRMLLQRLSA